MIQQVLEIDLFRVLRNDLGEEKLNALVQEKIVPVPGDISVVNLGLKDSDLLQRMWNEIDLIINIAATTNFDERYYQTIDNIICSIVLLKYRKLITLFSFFFAVFK